VDNGHPIDKMGVYKKKSAAVVKQEKNQQKPTPGLLHSVVFLFKVGAKVMFCP